VYFLTRSNRDVIHVAVRECEVLFLFFFNEQNEATPKLTSSPKRDDDENFGEKNNIEPNRPVWETGSKRHHPVFRTRNVRLAGRVAIFSQNETNAYH
tara:strand:+ start:26 stop:316 length:291 start_codon:yes stop_codon:yes gene_type:complete